MKTRTSSPEITIAGLLPLVFAQEVSRRGAKTQSVAVWLRDFSLRLCAFAREVSAFVQNLPQMNNGREL